MPPLSGGADRRLMPILAAFPVTRQVQPFRRRTFRLITFALLSLTCPLVFAPGVPAG